MPQYVLQTNFEALFKGITASSPASVQIVKLVSLSLVESILSQLLGEFFSRNNTWVELVLKVFITLFYIFLCGVIFMQLAEYKQSSVDTKDMVFTALHDFLSDEDTKANPTVRLIAGQIFFEDGNYKEALKLVHDGDTLELYFYLLKLWTVTALCSLVFVHVSN